MNRTAIHEAGHFLMFLKEAIKCTTPLKKELCELIVAVNRPYGKSDYLHCIAWNQLARKASNLKVGGKIRLSGRIQSRTYIKREHETETVKVAYEISVDTIAKER